MDHSHSEKRPTICFDFWRCFWESASVSPDAAKRESRLFLFSSPSRTRSRSTPLLCRKRWICTCLCVGQFDLFVKLAGINLNKALRVYVPCLFISLSRRPSAWAIYFAHRTFNLYKHTIAPDALIHSTSIEWDLEGNCVHVIMSSVTSACFLGCKLICLLKWTDFYHFSLAIFLLLYGLLIFSKLIFEIKNSVYWQLLFYQ